MKQIAVQIAAGLVAVGVVLGLMEVRGQLTRELRPGSRIVSYWLNLGDWEPQAVDPVPAIPNEPVGVVKLWIADGKVRPWLE